MLERWSARELQELYLLSAVQAEERGDLPPPPPEDVEDDDEPIDPDEPTDADLEALVQEEIERVNSLKKTAN